MHALIIVHIVYCNNKKTPYSFKQGGMLPNNTKALSKAYCIIRSSQMQAEHRFQAGCYFYTHF